MCSVGMSKRKIMDEYNLGRSTFERWIKSINVTGLPGRLTTGIRLDMVIKAEREDKMIHTKGALEQEALLFA